MRSNVSPYPDCVLIYVKRGPALKVGTPLTGMAVRRHRASLAAVLAHAGIP
jgi:hypothetical protein